ncbi:MAG: beta-ketoacyl-[acyl-carrier-protein] synthase family protein [Flavobacteriales bacterium]|jgi:3-oxoacyl-[acyl-carrier-protein] synthase-1|tara:strand:- start:709 stop:1905 length:1197 start_codon:yes stop_codon:yes gene_type:complete
MNKGVAITGMGIISSIGNTLEENFQSLKCKTPGISRIENITTHHKDHIKVGEIKISNIDFAAFLKLPDTHNYSRTALIGEIAAREAIKNAGITDINSCRTGLISATSVGGMDLTEKYFYSWFDDAENHKFIESHSAGDSTTKIANSLGITGFVSTISTACSSAANSIMLGARMIKAGKLDRVIVGGADCMSKFTINGFKTLMILSENDCMPFDANRTGLNLGEAGAYLVLESEECVKKDNKKVLGYVSGYANANDAFHQTASSKDGEGATLAMKKALKIADLSPKSIDYINAHGTATENNDASESAAIRRVFGENAPSVSSTKCFTGHTLAAAAAIEAVYSVLALQNNLVFPNLNFSTPIPETTIIPETELIEKELNHVLSNSFGFGGNCSTIIFSKA